jgi:large subunit ribosomal protein L14e
LYPFFHFIDVKGKWENSSWGKKLIVQKRRAALNDFDRFKVMLAKIKVRHFTTVWSIRVSCCLFHLLTLTFAYEQRGGAIRQELAKLRKEVAA